VCASATQLWKLPEAHARTGEEFEEHLRRSSGDGAEPADSGEEPGADAAATFSEDARSGNPDDGSRAAAGSAGGGGGGASGSGRAGSEGRASAEPEGEEGGGGNGGGKSRKRLTLKERVERCLGTERERLTFGKVRAPPQPSAPGRELLYSPACVATQ
jgi:hypothetical protein